jgi:alpha-amylase
MKPGICSAYSLRNLTGHDVLIWDRPAQAVTFVENHDIVRDSPILNAKLRAYAFILTHEGYPCVFWQDYFNWDLAQPDNQSGINALIKVQEQNAAGPVQVLFDLWAPPSGATQVYARV